MATGQDLIARALTRVGQRYVLGASVPLNNANWKGPWDCSEFVSWCVYQASGIVYGCDRNSSDPARADAYTGYWDRDATKLGVKITVEEALRTPGAALLRRPVVAGRPGHIALSDGRGGTVEARSSNLGVCIGTATGRSWDYGVLVPGITYTANAAIVPHTPPVYAYRYRKPNMRGSAVEQIQRALHERGIDPGPVDGLFGLQTDAAVRSFQAREGLTADGIVGPETALALGLLALGVEVVGAK